MKIVVFGITLIIGCFGQQVTPPKEPGLSQLPNGVPNLPLLENSVPGLPQLPNGVPNLPALANSVTGLPQLPNGVPNLPPLANTVPGLPQLPNGVPNLPPLANIVPGLPQLPNGVPNLPPLANTVPGLPQLPNGVPNLPPLANTVPGLPQLPNGLPQLPNALPQLPNGTLPNLPSVPAIPIIAASEVFERPCRPIDLACIRRYFQHHSKCQPAPGRVPDPLLRRVSNKFYSRVNITQTNLNPLYRGFNNGRIQEFYINRDTDKVVLGIDLPNIETILKDVFFTYHRRGREPIITHGSGNVLFRSSYLTVTIPQVDNLRLDKSDSYVFINEIPTYVLSPSLGQSSDPSVPVAFTDLQADLPTSFAELYLTESSYLAAVYIQHVICDFGLEII